MNDYQFNRWAVDAPLTGVSIERDSRYAAYAGGDGCVPHHYSAQQPATAQNLVAYPGRDSHIGPRLPGVWVFVWCG